MRSLSWALIRYVLIHQVKVRYDVKTFAELDFFLFRHETSFRNKTGLIKAWKSNKIVLTTLTAVDNLTLIAHFRPQKIYKTKPDKKNDIWINFLDHSCTKRRFLLSAIKSWICCKNLCFENFSFLGLETQLETNNCKCMWKNVLARS